MELVLRNEGKGLDGLWMLADIIHKIEGNTWYEVGLPNSSTLLLSLSNAPRPPGKCGTFFFGVFSAVDWLPTPPPWPAGDCAKGESYSKEGGGGWRVRAAALWPNRLWGAVRHRIQGSHMPLCHGHMVIATRHSLSAAPQLTPNRCRMLP